MQRPRQSALAFLCVTCVVACSNGSNAAANHPAASQAPSAPIVYAAVGASETVGVGATEPTRDAWPQVLFRTAMPGSTVFYNFGVPGVTVDGALQNELPEALSVQPTLVTVWLNVNDLIAGVAAPVYESQLDMLVHSLRRGGETRVLVANTPYLDHLPVYIECRAGTPAAGVTCPPVQLPPPDVLNAAVDQYNESIANVVQREGAVLVDLHSQGEVADLHPDWVSSDGFHPSTSGYVAIAAEFTAALKSAPAQP